MASCDLVAMAMARVIPTAVIPFVLSEAVVLTHLAGQRTL